MKTNLLPSLLATSEGQVADKILRSCVHCGFCNATCPTYQLLGDELDGPRGRIYLIKQVLEGATPTKKTQQHLDRCLHCLSCETTCPSGVKYGHLVDIGQKIVSEQVSRPIIESSARMLLLKVLPYPARFKWVSQLAHLLRPLLPQAFRLPPPVDISSDPSAASCSRHKILLQGCVQSTLKPETNHAATRILSKLGIQLSSQNDGCCGALSYHLGDQEQGLAHARKIMDKWHKQLSRGSEDIVITASGCGAFIKNYKHLFKDDPNYREKAIKISAATKDISEVLHQENWQGKLNFTGQGTTLALHTPCTLQHGGVLKNHTQEVLEKAGFTLQPSKENHLCCGSAGTYSIFQAKLSKQLRENKIKALTKGKAVPIVTSNIGCQLHLGKKAPKGTMHWIELLNRHLEK